MKEIPRRDYHRQGEEIRWHRDRKQNWGGRGLEERARLEKNRGERRKAVETVKYQETRRRKKIVIHRVEKREEKIY